jgi:hypothetical protein
MTTCMTGRRSAMTGRRSAMTRRRPGRYRGNGRRLMPLGPVGLLGRIPPAPVAASTGGGPGVEGARYRSSRWQAAIRCGGIAVALRLSFRGKRPLWWDPTKLKAPAPAMRPKAQRGCPKEPQTHDQRGEANAPHPGHVRRADLPSLDRVVHDEGTLSGARPSPRVASARETGFSEVRGKASPREIAGLLPHRLLPQPRAPTPFRPPKRTFASPQIPHPRAVCTPNAPPTQWRIELGHWYPRRTTPRNRATRRRLPGEVQGRDSPLRGCPIREAISRIRSRPPQIPSTTLSIGALSQRRLALRLAMLPL